MDYPEYLIITCVRWYALGDLCGAANPLPDGDVCVAENTRTTTDDDKKQARKRPAHPSPYSTWAAIAMLLPGLAVVAALVWTTGYVLAWYAAAVNVATFLLYWHDKSAAKKQVGRVPELVLHAMALAGGTPGALLAGRLFRHKTRKWQFQAVYWPTVAIHLALAAWGMSGILTARGWNGPMWTAFGTGVLAAINVAAFVVEPMRSRGRSGAARLVLLLLGGGLGAAFRDQRGPGAAWWPYLAGTAQLAAALAPALMAVRAMVGLNP